MKIGVISDIHGNYIALQQSLKFLKQFPVDEIFFLGDAVGYMPQANEVIDTLKKEKVKSLLGNHEAMLIGWLPNDPKSEMVYQLTKTRESIKNTNLDFIRGLLPFREVTVSGVKILMVHGSPWNPLNGYVYPNTDISNVKIPSFDFILMGHTHRPFAKQYNSTWFVNVGSSGMPRDVGCLASLAVIDTKKKVPEIYRLPMDVAAMARDYSEWVHPDVERLWARNDSTQIVVGEIIL